MKKKIQKKSVAAIICVLFASAVLFAGCSSSGKGESTGAKEENITIEDEGKAPSATEEVADVTTEETTTVEEEDKPAVADEAADEKESSGGSVEDLYQDFLDGKAGTKFKGSSEHASYLTLSSVLEEGKAYDINEIKKKIKETNPDMFADCEAEIVENTLIDCGSDGNKELLVKYQIEAGEIYTLFNVIKEKDGELNIIFSDDMWSRSEINIADNGVVTGTGSGGASIHEYEEGYIDANGDYRFGYGEETNIAPFELYLSKNNEYISIDLSDLDVESFQVNTCWLEENRDGCENYHTYYMLDKDYNDITKESDFDDDNPYKKKFTDNGIKVYTHEEIQQLIDSHEKEIGFPGK
ncbi:MAG: hypothetical protein K6F99_05085 [Lachnospiraceae bacterium]|nr:hypothetical protein [Lachnospiraceae bacterium]